MGDPNASIPTPEPVRYRPMFGALGRAPDGLWVEGEEIRHADGSESDQCLWQPRYLELPRPLEVGREWSIDSTCQEGSYTRHRQGTARVTGSDTIEINGARHDVFVIERTIDTSLIDENGVPLATQRRQLTDRWAPSLRLLALSEGIVATTVGGIEQNSSPERRELVDPTPVR